MFETIKRLPPEPIRQRLRAEAGFGCAYCGNPILEYHHIIPWRDEQLHRPEHMVALCPTHHTEIANFPRSYAYKLKSNPHNKKDDIWNGHLGSERNSIEYVVGSNIFRDTPTILSLFLFPIVGIEIIGGRAFVQYAFLIQSFDRSCSSIEMTQRSRLEEFGTLGLEQTSLTLEKQGDQTFLQLIYERIAQKLLEILILVQRSFLFQSPKLRLVEQTNLR